MTAAEALDEIQTAQRLAQMRLGVDDFRRARMRLALAKLIDQEALEDWRLEQVIQALAEKAAALREDDTNPCAVVYR